ncbi:MAG TPA: creatininase family protein [Afifellaceae bacterium]|nr:creatininase family protein [Afifellaceae bacterium]
MTPYRDWQELTTKDFQALDPATSVAVLPVGAIEQHGPHLPVATDAVIAEAVARQGLAQLDGSFTALLLPPQSIGKSNEHLAFAGTLTFSADQLIALWTSIGEGVHRAGLKKMIFLNSHGGQPQVMEIVARELRVRFGMMAVSSSWWHMGFAEGLIPEDEQRYGIHGGFVETSMMLHLRPELVKMDRARNFRPVMAELEGEYKRLRHLGGVGIGWQAQDIHEDGVAGDASAASAETGQKIVDHAAAGFAELVAETARFPLGRIRQR